MRPKRLLAPAGRQYDSFADAEYRANSRDATFVHPPRSVCPQRSRPGKRNGRLPDNCVPGKPVRRLPPPARSRSSQSITYTIVLVLFVTRNVSEIRIAPKSLFQKDLERVSASVTVAGATVNRRVYDAEPTFRLRGGYTSPEHDGRFILELRVPEREETHKVTLVAASEDNVIVTKQIEVKIVPAE